MIYEILKPLVDAALKAYFKRIDVRGKENLEHHRLVLVSNHPSALFDPLAVAITSKKPLHFITGAEWFGTGLKDCLFKSQFHMIPVYRPWLKTGKDKDNDDMFRECYVSLEKGASIIIYPEAESITVPWIRELKTGAARIKMGADDYLNEHGYNDEVKLVPVGLNYTNPKRFQSRLLINVGDPVDFSDVDRSGDPKEVARLMTEKIKSALEDTVLHVEEEADYPVIKAAMKLLTDALLTEMNLKPNDYSAAFEVQKSIIHRIETIKKSEPERIESLEKRLFSYLEQFESLGFRRFNPFETQLATKLTLLAGSVLGFPFFLVGLLVNGLPLWGSYAFFNAILLDKVTGEHRQGTINPAFAGSLAWATGLAFFVIWYIGLSIFTAEWFPWWLAWPASWIIGYQMGRFALVYSHWIKRLRRIFRWNTFVRRSPDESRTLLAERSALISELMALYRQTN